MKQCKKTTWKCATQSRSVQKALSRIINKKDVMSGTISREKNDIFSVLLSPCHPFQIHRHQRPPWALWPAWGRSQRSRPDGRRRSPKNGYRIYVDIMKGEKCRRLLLANMDIIYWSLCSSSRRGGKRIKEVDGGDRYFSQLQVLLY